MTDCRRIGCTRRAYCRDGQVCRRHDLNPAAPPKAPPRWQGTETLPARPLVEAARRQGVNGPAGIGVNKRVSVFLADEFAVRQLGTHPAALYGPDWWEVAA